MSTTALPNTLYRNNGNGTFTDITRAAGVYTTGRQGSGRRLRRLRRRWPAGLVRGQRSACRTSSITTRAAARFEKSGCSPAWPWRATAEPRAGMGTDFGDYDGDGRLDLVVTNFELETHNLFRNLGGGLFADATLPERHRFGHAARSSASAPCSSTTTTTAHLDLAIANGHVLDNASHFHAASTYAQRNLLLRNDGHGRFIDVGSSAGPGFALEKSQPRARRRRHRQRRRSRPARDQQRPDRGPAAERRRQSRQCRLLVKLTGTKSNRDGIGARLRADRRKPHADPRQSRPGSSYLGQNDLRAALRHRPRTRDRAPRRPVAERAHRSSRTHPRQRHRQDHRRWTFRENAVRIKMINSPQRTRRTPRETFSANIQIDVLLYSRRARRSTEWPRAFTVESTS